MLFQGDKMQPLPVPISRMRSDGAPVLLGDDPVHQPSALRTGIKHFRLHGTVSQEPGFAQHILNGTVVQQLRDSCSADALVWRQRLGSFTSRAF